MKRFVFMMALPLFFYACACAPEADKAEVGDAIEIVDIQQDSNHWVVDTIVSLVSWIGSKPTASHHGNFKLSNGFFVLENGSIKSGVFTINVNSLEVVDLDQENNLKLANHLLSEDFFNSVKFPTAKFIMAHIAPFSPDSFPNEKVFTKNPTHIITGNLTLNDSTKSIRFPAIIFTTEKSISAQANFNINRSDWGLSYGNDQSLGDKFISPTVNLNLEIKTK
ncbi:MAG: YceI family protein [Bacteroidetes bacterium]|nr:YceI family protein [Bacteroidota bacterium]